MLALAGWREAHGFSEEMTVDPLSRSELDDLMQRFPDTPNGYHA